MGSVLVQAAHSTLSTVNIHWLQGTGKVYMQCNLAVTTLFCAGMAGEYIVPIIGELLTMMRLPNMVLAAHCPKCMCRCC